jgi:hypothetical protein
MHVPHDMSTVLMAEVVDLLDRPTLHRLTNCERKDELTSRSQVSGRERTAFRLDLCTRGGSSGSSSGVQMM